MPNQKNSVIEKAGIAIAMSLLVGLIIYFVQYTKSEYRIITEPEYTSNVPVAGKYASIKSVTTQWVRRNDDSESLYPSATIELDPESSSSGYLRTFFRNSLSVTDKTSKVVGDSNTLHFKNGIFENGESVITVTCTQGLASEAEFLGYSTQDETRWTIQMSESSSGGGEDFKQLAQAPIKSVIQTSHN